MTGEIPDTDNSVLQRVFEALDAAGSEWFGNEDWTCPGPSHDDGDQKPSLSVAEGTDKPVVMRCHAGCETKDVVSAIGLTMSDLSAPETATRVIGTTRYFYTDADGVPKYVVHRIEYSNGKKDFRQFPVDAEGKITKHRDHPMKGVELLLWKLPEVIAQAGAGGTIYLVEGEKSVLAIAEYVKVRGHAPVVATTAPGGASNNWRSLWTECLRGAGEVVIVADNDPAGYQHAGEVFDALKAAGIPARVVRSLTDDRKDDVVEHLNAEHHIEDLAQLTRAEVDELAGAESDDDGGRDEDQVPPSWSPVDLTDALAGNRPAEPTVLRRVDEKALLYPGRTHVVYGEPESMKSWICLVACAEQVMAGATVVYLDFEDDEHETVDRMRCLGVSDGAIKESFIYIRPDDPLPPETRDRYVAAIARHRPSLVVLDGVTEAMALHDLEPLDNKDIADWNRLPRAIARAGVDVGSGYLGPAVVSIDHAPKDKDNRGGPIGGQHKIAGISGAAYYLETTRPFGLGLEGVARVRVTKDRPGRVREVAAGDKRNQMGALTLRSNATTRAIDWDLAPALGVVEPDRNELSTAIPDEVIEAVSVVFEEGGAAGYSKKAVEDRVTGKGAKFRRPAIARLIASGYVAPHPTTKWNFVSIRPWRAATDGVLRVTVGRSDAAPE